MTFFSTTSWKQTAPKIGLPKCGQCGLYKVCESPKMEPGGRGKVPILFVGEAPSKRDDREGVHFADGNGWNLRTILEEIGEDLENCHQTNSIICKPTKGLIENYHIEACRPNLLKTIKEIEPKVIILMGHSPAKTLLATEWGKDIGEITKWVGWNIPSAKYKTWICPTYPPSWITRSGDADTMKLLMRGHIQKAFDLIDVPFDAPDITELKNKIEIITNPRLARLRMKELADKEGMLAFDFETTGLKPDDEKQEIVSVSFCLEGEDTFACMVDDKAMRSLSMVLRNPKFKMIASNAKFEERWAMAKLGHGVPNWYWDTMIVAHMLDNRSKITSIKFQTYVHLGIGDYDSHIQPFLKSQGSSLFNRIRQIDPEELLIYNGLDALLEYMVAIKQMEILDAE